MLRISNSNIVNTGKLKGLIHIFVWVIHVQTVYALYMYTQSMLNNNLYKTLNINLNQSILNVDRSIDDHLH